MKRMLNALGLAILATLALNVIAAPTASAYEGHLTATEPVTLTGTEVEGGTNALTAFGAEVQCDDHYDGTKTSTTEPLTPGETSATITPTYTNCTSEVTLNGCDYEFYDFTTNESGNYSVEVDVVCPEGVSGILIHGSFNCDTTVSPQEGLTGAEVSNTSGDIRLIGTFTGIKATNPCLGETTKAQLHTDVTIEGRNESGASVAISIGSEQEGRLTAAEPVMLTGTEVVGGANATTMFDRTIECDDHYDGTKTNSTEPLSSGETSVTVSPTYTECANEVTLNGCDYEYYDFTTNANGNYSFDVDLVCPEGVSGIVMHGSFNCDTTIPPQSGLTGVEAINQEGHVRLVGSLTGIRMTNPCLGETTDAVQHTDVTFEGVNLEGKPTPVSLSH